MENLDITILKYLATHRRYVKISKIAYFTRIHQDFIKESITRLEGSRMVLSTGKVRKKPNKLLKELMMRKVPELYEEVEKEYKISQIGISKLREVE